MHQPPWPAIDQRQRRSNGRMSGRAKAQNLGQRKAKHHPCFGIIGQRLLGLAVDQNVEINRPAQSFLRNRDRQRTIRRREALGRVSGGLVHRGAHTHHGIKQAQGSAAGGQAGNFFSHNQAH